MKKNWRELLLAFLLGFASLGGQICWFRIATAAVGSTAISATISLAVAMAGLCAGAFLAGYVVRHKHDRSLLFFMLACAIMLIAIPFLLQVITSWGSLAIRRLLVGTLLFLGNLSFGACLPLITMNYDRNERGWFYFANAFGSVLGAMIIGVFLVHFLALDTISVLLGMVILAGALLYIKQPLSKKWEPDHTKTPRLFFMLVFLLGFLGLAAELMWFRTLGFFWNNGTQTYAFVTAAYIAGLAAGSWFATLLVRRLQPVKTVMWCCFLAAIALLIATWQSPQALGVNSALGRITVTMIFVVVPAACSAAAFVFLLGASSRQDIGTLFAMNSIGAALGPLILWLGVVPTWALEIVALAYCVIGIILAMSMRKQTVMLVVAVLIFILSVQVFSNPFAAIFTHEKTDFQATSLIFSKVDTDTFVAVTRDSHTGGDALYIDRNNQGDASLWSMRVKQDFGMLPGTLRSSDNALLIGLGTGVTAAALLPHVKHLDVAEVSPGVIVAANGVLQDMNDNVLDHANIQVHHADGRSMLTDSSELYDLIVVDIVYPSVPGAGNLFSKEFYKSAHDHLSHEGIFVQWVPAFQLSPQDLSAVTNGFLESFPEGIALIHFLRPTGLVIGFIGGNIPQPLPESHTPYFAFGPTELRALANNVPPIRDADPRLEYRSPPPSEFSYERQIVQQVSTLLQTTNPPQYLIADKQWQQTRDAWLLFAQGGLASQKEKYEQAEKLAPIVPAEYILELYELQETMESVMKSNDVATQEKLLRKASLFTSDEGNIQLAVLLRSQGRLQEAEEQVREAIIKYPRSADNYMTLTIILYEQERYQEAKQALDQAKKLRPKHPPLYIMFEQRLQQYETQTIT